MYPRTPKLSHRHHSGCLMRTHCDFSCHECVHVLIVLALELTVLDTFHSSENPGLCAHSDENVLRDIWNEHRDSHHYTHTLTANILCTQFGLFVSIASDQAHDRTDRTNMNARTGAEDCWTWRVERRMTKKETIHSCGASNVGNRVDNWQKELHIEQRATHKMFFLFKKKGNRHWAQFVQSTRN